MPKIEFNKSPNARSKEQFAAFDVATIEYEFEGTLTIDGQEVDAAGFEYVLDYGLRQALADSFAAHIKRSDAVKAFDARLDKIMSGTIVAGQRTGDPIMQEMKALALKKLCAHLKMSEAKARETYKDGQLSKLVAKVIEMNREELEARAAIIVAERSAGDNIVMDGLADLLGTAPANDEAPEGEESGEGEGSEGGEEPEEKEEPQVETPEPAKKGRRKAA